MNIKIVRFIARFYSLFLVLSIPFIFLLPISPIIAETDDDFVILDKNMDIVELIKTASEINNKTYILDESVKSQEIMIITPEGRMKKEDFLKYFDSILNLNGLSVVKNEGINKVISSDRIKEESTPMIIELGQ